MLQHSVLLLFGLISINLLFCYFSKEMFLLSEAKKSKKKKSDDSLKDPSVQLHNRVNNTVTSHYTFNKPIIPPVSVTASKTTFILGHTSSW